MSQEKSTEQQYQFGHYQILSELGRGGMGCVYKAYDTKLERTVALKLILGGQGISPRQLKRFILEARATAQLQHPNIIAVYDVGETPKPYFTMEYIEGDTLAALSRQRLVTPRKAAKIIMQCADALSLAHKNGIVHRDIKPSNIMMIGQKTPKIMDFGLAKMIHKNHKLSKDGDFLGTPAYMSPEQANQEDVKGASDIYSLGASLYDLLTGRPPFEGDSHFHILAQLSQKDPIAPRMLKPDIPIDLEAICLKCLEKKPSARYKDAQALAKDLENFIENRPISAKQSTRWTILQKWGMRNKTAVFVSLLSFFLVVLSVATIIILQMRANQTLAGKNSALEKANEIVEQEKEKAQKEKEKAQKAQKEAIEERDLAQEVLYSMNLTLAQRYCQEKKIRKATDLLYHDYCPEEKRGWEWKWLNHLLDDNFQTLSCNEDMGTCVSSPDGRYLAATTILSKNIHLWDQFSGTKVVLSSSTTDAKGSDRDYCCAFSPDSKKLAALKDDGELTIWNLQSQEKICTLSHSNMGTHCVFSPDGKKVLCGYRGADQSPSEQGSTLVLWDIQKRRIIQEWNAHAKVQVTVADNKKALENDVLCCDFSPDGKKIITGGGDFRIQVWDISRQNPEAELTGHRSMVNSCSYSPDGKYILSGSDDKTLILWNSQDGSKEKVYLGHSDAVSSSCFSSDGKQIVSGSDDNLVILWETQSARILKKFSGHLAGVKACTFVDQNRVIVSASADTKIKLWDVKTPPKPFSSPDQGKEIIYTTFSPDGKTIASLRRDSPKVELWDSRSYQLISSQPYTSSAFVRSCSLSPDGQKFVLAVKTPPSIAVFEKTKQKPLFSLDLGNFSYAYTCVYSPDGNLVAGSGNKDVFYIWDAREKNNEKGKRKALLAFQGFRPNIRKLVFSPDGKMIAGVSEGENNVKIWDARLPSSPSNLPNEPRLPIMVLKNRDYGPDHLDLLGCDFSPEGKRIIATGDDSMIKMWDLESKKLIAVFQGHLDIVYQCYFLSGGKRIVSAGRDKSIKIWDTEAKGKKESGVRVVNRALLSLEKHAGWIRALAVSPNGRQIASGSKDQTLKIWDSK